MSDTERPIACSLEAGDFTRRLAWIAALNARALRGVRRAGLRLELTFAPEARDDVLIMVRGEQACCAFLTFEISETAEAVRVVITAPEGAREAIDDVFAPFEASAAPARGCGCGAGAAA
jgi:hypothetical protein